MKHTKKTALTAAMLTAAMSMTAALTLTSCYPQIAYGPPDTEETAVSNAEPSSYEPSTEEIQDVYGPPPVEYEDEPIVTTKIEVIPEETTVATVGESTEVTTKAADMQVVYGPPNAIDE